MIEKYTLLAFEEDIKEADFIDWLEAHTSFMMPLHRYKGMIELNSDNIVFTGVDVKNGEEYNLEIPIKNINDVHLGFDDVFKRRDDRSPWNKPLRIRFKEDDDEKTIYLFINFHRTLRTTDNKKVYQKLIEICDLK